MYPKEVLFLVLVNLCTNVLSHVSGITFENGQYKNILIALSDELDVSNCVSILDSIKINLEALSTKLHSATDSKASIGSVDILFPSSWRQRLLLSECNLASSNISKEKVFQTYKTADIKITEQHPISKEFPWAKQYKPCGHASEAIYISPAFLSKTTWNLERKGNILLHEWAKFRYGVFEEFGFFDDELYSPCYVKGGKWHFTTCSNGPLDSIHSSSTESINCRSVVSSNNNALSASLNGSSSSIMGSPHLSNVAGFCRANNHNIFAPTKHNSLCGRKSVNEVVMSHTDFSGSRKSTLQTPSAIVIRYLHRDLTLTPPRQGYAFVIEDGPKIREHDRLRVIKQSITQVVDLIPMSDTELVRISFNESASNVRTVYTTENGKIEFVEHDLPDRNTELRTQSELKSKKRLGTVFEEVVSTLNTRQPYDYNIIYIVSQTSTASEFEAAIATVKSSRHSLTIITFDDSEEWLAWNSIPNTKKVLYFPTCSDSSGSGRNLCNAKLTTLLTDSLLETLGHSQSRYFHKVAELQINLPQQTFSIPNKFDESTNIVVVVPIFGDTDVENLIHFKPPLPLNGTCSAKKMLNYNFVIQMDTSEPNCKFQGGEWSVVMDETFVQSGPHMLLVYLETKGSTSDLTVTTGIGHSLKDTLDPSTGLTPVYATVSSSSDLPVIGAKVTLDLFSGAQLVPTTITLKDDGLFPDNTKGDGVYSTILKGFSRNPATHLGQIHVNTNASANVIKSLPDVGNAALIDTHSTLFSRKCCGSSITVQTSGLNPIGESSYSVFIPSFKTSANSDPSQIPPSKIESVKITSVDDNLVRLQFNAPGENYDSGIVARYDICCYPKENQPTPQCKAIPIQDCSPIDVGKVQDCNIYKTLINDMDAHPGDSLSWICGIRGVNSANISGEVSGNIVEIQFSSASSAGDTKCESISDGCLPIWIFWVLIGCVAALTLLVLILIICWCCVSRRNQTQQTPKKTFEKNKKKTGKIPDKDSPLYNVYVNQAYIQDSDGQLKLVASDGELLPYDTKTNERGDDLGYATQNSGPQTPVLNSQRLATVRRKSLSANAKEPENVSSFKPVDNSRKHVSWNQENNSPVFKVMKDEDYDVGYNAMNNKPNLGRHLSKSEEFITVTPKAKDRQPKSMVGYANPMIVNNANKNKEAKMTPVPSITSTVDTYNRNDWLNSNIDDDTSSLGPIYASVNRNGNRGVGNGKPVVPPSYGGYDPNRVHSAAPTVPPSRESVTLKKAWNPLGAGRFTRGTNNRNNRSMRLDAFPSSESETYSDISRGIPVPPPPPPLPTAADLKRTSAYQVPPKIPSRRSSSDDSDTTMTEHNSIRNAPNIPKPATTVSRSPPKDKSFAGIRSHMEQQLNTIYSNPNPKPLPPPRQDKFPKSSVSNASSFGSRVVEMGEVDDEDYYDEDSDCWDDGDDMEEYHPGHSYA